MERVKQEEAKLVQQVSKSLIRELVQDCMED
jgi:hypothetical protein